MKLQFMLRMLCTASLLAASTGCANKIIGGSSASPEVYEKQEKAIAEFERINKVFDAGNYEEAAERYDVLFRNSTVNNLDTLILFNAGLSYQLIGDCEKANERFREVVRRAKGQAPSMKTRALLKIGEVYICLGDDSKAIVNLIEAYSNRAQLPPELGKAELPARLAAAYARIGNRKMAEKYFKIAERGLIEVQIKSKNPKELKEALARTLYSMGTLSQLNVQTMSGEDYFATLKALQKYLFKSIELDAPEWSLKAYEEINLGYENVWKYVDNVPVLEAEDVRLAKRDAQVKKLEVVNLALDSLKSLYKERIPDPEEPALISGLLAKMQQHEAKMRNFVATNIVGSTLTEEALAAQAIRKAGRVYNPDPILERQSLKRLQKENIKKKPTQRTN